jgi:hypothetical protein
MTEVMAKDRMALLAQNAHHIKILRPMILDRAVAVGIMQLTTM